MRRVWASKWGERAVAGLRSAGVAHRDLQMAVLCQRVVPARYAFVAHTVHPTTGAAPLGLRAALMLGDWQAVCLVCFLPSQSPCCRWVLSMSHTLHA